MIRFLSPLRGIGAIVCVALATPALAQVALKPSLLLPVTQLAPIRHGELHGTVQGEDGQPLVGAMVSAVGSTTAFAVSDREGRFVFRALQAGPYLVRAHLTGYVPARGRIVQVTPDARNLSNILLTRRADPAEPPEVLAAGVGTTGSSASPVKDEHEHDEVAWRLRHAKRSVLKDAESAVAALGGDDSLFEDSLSGLGRAVGDSARLASALFADSSINGQINLLTTTSFNRPQDFFSMNMGAPRGVAYLALRTPGPSGDWLIRGTITQGDLASWILAGAYVRRTPASHEYEAGVSYGTQRYMGGNPEALAAMRDGSRNVGAIYAYDSWTVTPRFQLGYGAKYASYDYLTDRGLLSPRLSITVEPFDGDRVKLRGTVSRLEIAPGAEEFLPPTVGLWLPPERTFSHVSHDEFLRERVDTLEIAAEREVPGGVVVGMRAFRQRVDDQTVTLFGVALLDSPANLGHYHVGSAGGFTARGWGASVSRELPRDMRATLDYTQTWAAWETASPDQIALAGLSASTLRTDERIHDLTASFQSLVAPTATRVFVVYKLNTAFAAADPMDNPTAGVRFNVQVNQPLPFLDFTNAHWEMLAAVTNLFRTELFDGSVYDELLVVRPPKRVLGGVTVRF